MKRSILILLLIVLFCPGSFPQGGGFEIEAGTGTYSMHGLKSLNRIIKIEIPFDTKIVASFPPWLNYAFYAKLRMKNTCLGVVYSFQTTGSRISGKDYSGEYYFDFTVNGHAPGIYGEYYFSSDSRIKYSITSTVGIIFTGLKMHEYFNLLDQQIIDENYLYKSRNLFYEPGFMVTYPFRSVKLGVRAGYLFQFGEGSFKNREEPDLMLVNPYSGEAVKPGWSGIRAGLSVGWYFGGKPDVSGKSGSVVSGK